VTAFRALVAEHGLPASRIALAGDSAGGGLAVAAARVLTDAALQPAALGLLSPWTDPSDEAFTRQRDRATNLAWGRRSAALYRSSADHDDPGYEPIHGRLDDLPPVLIQCSTKEMLHPQILRFAALARRAGVATDAVHELGIFLRTHLDAQPGSVPAAKPSYGRRLRSDSAPTRCEVS